MSYHIPTIHAACFSLLLLMYLVITFLSLVYASYSFLLVMVIISWSESTYMHPALVQYICLSPELSIAVLTLDVMRSEVTAHLQLSSLSFL